MKETCFQLGLKKQLSDLRKENPNGVALQEANKLEQSLREYINS
jgi:hypothetical protein